MPDRLFVHCDSSQGGGYCFGAYAVGHDPPVVVGMSGENCGTKAEIELVCEIIKAFDGKEVELTIYHDVAGMSATLKKAGFKASRWLVSLLNTHPQVTLIYVPRAERHEQYSRCHRVAYAAVQQRLNVK